MVLKWIATRLSKSWKSLRWLWYWNPAVTASQFSHCSVWTYLWGGWCLCGQGYLCIFRSECRRSSSALSWVGSVLFLKTSLFERSILIGSSFLLSAVGWFGSHKEWLTQSWEWGALEYVAQSWALIVEPDWSIFCWEHLSSMEWGLERVHQAVKKSPCGEEVAMRWRSRHAVVIFRFIELSSEV